MCMLEDTPTHANVASLSGELVGVEDRGSGAGDIRELANAVTGAMIAHVKQVGGERMLEQVLEVAGENRSVAELQDANGWSSHEQALTLFGAAAEVLGDPLVGWKAGEQVLRAYAGTEMVALLRSLGSPAEMIRLYPQLSAKQSTVTRTEIIEVDNDHALLSVTTTPPIERSKLFCDYIGGAMSQFPVLFGMDPAEVVEVECQTRGDPRCLVRVSWDPSSSLHVSLEREADFLRSEVKALTVRFESLATLAKDLASIQDVDAVLAAVVRGAGVVVRAPRYLLAVQLPGESSPRVHHVGFSAREANDLARELLGSEYADTDVSRICVDVASSRYQFGRLAAIYPEGYQFFPHERSLLMAYAGHAAAALEIAAALDESQHRNDTLGALLDLGTALSQLRSRDDVAALLAEAMLEIVGADIASVLLWDSADLTLRRAAFLSKDAGLKPRYSTSQFVDGDIAKRMLESPAPVILDEASNDAFLGGLLRASGLASGMIAPVIARQQFLGAVAVGLPDGARGLESATSERLTGVISLAATALESALLVDQMHHQALHDPLTDLANSRLFADRVTYACSVAVRAGTQLALLFIDLDRFKSVNDTHGHGAGDDLLQAVAERLLGIARTADTVARLGGDEFAIMLQDVQDLTGAERVAERIVSALSEPFMIRGNEVSLGASVGIALAATTDDGCEATIARADAAMYVAKGAGGGSYHVAQ
jgi:diguanylate cyclase (GGDEF)-like protein